jgi:hypothetical protein
VRGGRRVSMLGGVIVGSDGESRRRWKRRVVWGQVRVGLAILPEDAEIHGYPTQRARVQARNFTRMCG